jgi:putative serine protease PepD
MIGSGVVGALLVDTFNSPDTKTVVQAAPVQTTSPETGAPAPTESLAKVAKAVMPTVVSITVETGSGGDEGSGIVLRSDGTILTNNHVVAPAVTDGGTISVKFSNGKTAAAKIVGRDPTVDLAVIKADGVSGITPASLGSSKNLNVGDTVLAIGSPLGLDGSVTAGIVSSLHRTVDLGTQEAPLDGGTSTGAAAPDASVGDAIQTDAAINPGNSGGALVDSRGRVVGINTAIASTGSSSDSGAQSGNIGVGFAIPIDEASIVATQLINGQVPKHALIGVQISDDTNGGAILSSVSSGGPAAKAGLKSGDVVTRVDSTSVPDAASLAAIVRAHQPGDTVTVQYTRNGTPHTTTVTLAATS